ncbi:cbb3-type cytochrome c oxidase subunit 3 [Methylosinus sp. Sm6]|nr:cbb3-type cytochrome c oxidase subunit 3 [Methylosinus sp. Sm6]MBY6242500.1 cbb3-type cytochrome c oxidase subunit 3 [Methylosinus sp. Sm6]
MTYEFWRDFAAGSGLFFFAAIFGVAVGYAFWPANRERFDRAARAPLRED